MSGETPELLGFINGALTTLLLVAAFFFVKFWRRTGETLFAAFAAAFALLGIAQPIPMFTGAQDEAPAEGSTDAAKEAPYDAGAAPDGVALRHESLEAAGPGAVALEHFAYAAGWSVFD